MRKVWPFAANFFVYGALAALVPLLVVHYQENLAFSGAQIGLLVGIPPIITVFAASFWGDLVDRTGRVRRIWGALLAAGIASALLLAVAVDFWWVLVALALFNVASAPFPAFVDSSTMHMLGSERDQYGRLRLGGTLGFGLLALVGGVVADRVGIPASFVLAAVVYGIAWAVSTRMEFPSTLGSTQRLGGGVGDILADRRWSGFLVLAVTGGIAIGVANGYLYPHIGALGGSESVMGLASLVGTLAEIPVLLVGHRLLRRFRPFHLVAAAVVAAGLRSVGFGLATAPIHIVGLQLLHGLTFILMWVAAVAFVDLHAAPGRRTTAQGVFVSAFLGVGAAVGGLAGGPVLTTFGTSALFTWFGIGTLVLVAIVVATPGLAPGVGRT